MNKIIAALLATTAAMGAAQAQTVAATAPQAYIGIGAATAENRMTDDYRTNAKIFGGYEFDRNWAVEGGYTHLGSKDYNALIPGNQFVTASVKGSDTYVAAKYTVPLNERFSAYGKLGVSHSERKNSIPGWGSFTDRDTGVYGGAGLQYALNQNLAVVGEYERYGKDKQTGSKADVLTVGLKYGF